MRREWTNEFAIAISIRAKRLAGIFEGVLQYCRSAVLKRMGERVGRINPFKTVLV